MSAPLVFVNGQMEHDAMNRPPEQRDAHKRRMPSGFGLFRAQNLGGKAGVRERLGLR
jgi:hypothetical protein